MTGLAADQLREDIMERKGIGCRVSEVLANMKCRGCFEAEVVCFEGKKEDPAGKGGCECRLKFNPELLDYGFE